MMSFALSLGIWSSFQQLIACMPVLVALHRSAWRRTRPRSGASSRRGGSSSRPARRRPPLLSR